MGRMVAASLACGVITLGFTGAAALPAVAAGAAGPLAAAVGSWTMVARLHASAPAQVSAAMVRLFAAKLLFFAAYVAAAVLLMRPHAVALVASFTAQYITLHFLEAFYLRRLFLHEAGPASAR